MIVQTKTIWQHAAFIFAAFGCLAAAPAHANTASSAVAADVTAPVETKGSPMGEGDAEFQQLFAKWESLDRTTGTAAPVMSISIPSRMPLDNATLTSDFGMRDHPVLRKRARHKGVDLAAPTGTPVYATADGLVQMAEWFSSYGNFIKIGHGNDLETRYAHLSRIAVSSGANVKKGDLIGYVGSTGRSTGPHLHYEVRISGKAVNPIPYMAQTKSQIAFAEATGEPLAAGGE